MTVSEDEKSTVLTRHRGIYFSMFLTEIAIIFLGFLIREKFLPQLCVLGGIIIT